MYLETSEGLGQAQPAIRPTSSTTERSCRRVQRLKVGSVAVWSLVYSPFFFQAGMAMDADGAPNAYHPANTGIDFLKNAGYPPAPGRKPWGIVTDAAGNPVIQGKNDPFPGYYVSPTSLGDASRPRSDPRRYVDSTQIPYIALPKAMATRLSAKLGDFATVINSKNRRISHAIFADIGPAGKLGEGSIALAQALGHNPFVVGKVRSGISSGVIYIVFPGSGNDKPRTVAEINSEGEKLFKSWGGMTRVKACFFPVESMREQFFPWMNIFPNTK